MEKFGLTLCCITHFCFAHFSFMNSHTAWRQRTLALSRENCVSAYIWAICQWSIFALAVRIRCLNGSVLWFGSQEYGGILLLVPSARFCCGSTRFHQVPHM